MRKNMQVGLVIIACVIGIAIQYLIYQTGYRHGVHDTLNSANFVMEEKVESDDSDADRQTDLNSEEQLKDETVKPTPSVTPETENQKTSEPDDAASTSSPAPKDTSESGIQSEVTTSSPASEITTSDDLLVTEVKADPASNMGNGETWQFYYVYVRNDTSETISDISVDVSLLDENQNIIYNTSAVATNRVDPGQIVALRDWIYISGAKYIEVDSYKYLTNDANSATISDYFSVSYEPAPLTEGEHFYQLIDSKNAVIQ